MKKCSKIVLISLCVLLVGGAVTYAALSGDKYFLIGQLYQSADPYDGDDIVAEYHDHQITRSVLTYQMNISTIQSGQSGQNSLTEREVLDQILENVILTEEAERLGLAATEEEIEAMVQSSRQSYELPDGKKILDSYCAGAGITIEEYFTLIREQAPRMIARQKIKDAWGQAYCEEAGIEFTKVNQPEGLSTYVNDRIAALFESCRQDIVYYLPEE